MAATIATNKIFFIMLSSCLRSPQYLTKYRKAFIIISGG
nr:MAG TPA: hypothetical protein [Caudoviricetes sp.]